MKNLIWIVCLVFLLQSSSAQVLPASRSIDWSVAGLIDSFPQSTATYIDMQNFILDSTGTTPNDSILNVVLAGIVGPTIIEFPQGNFLFTQTINLPSNIILKGKGAELTKFTVDLGGSGHSIRVQGTTTTDTTSIIQSVSKDSNYILVWNSTLFSVGDWIGTQQYDTDWVVSTWSEGKTGQINQISSISNDTIWFKSPLRMNYDTARSPFITKINPVKNVGIECLTIERMDDTAPQHSSNVLFYYAVNCWVVGIEGFKSTNSHISASFCSNLWINKCYFHHGFTYGGGGRAYGIVLQFATGECLIEDNIFEHLRHSILIQAGANGNVSAYNYSLDPFWDEPPFSSDSGGEWTLHGNYPYCNLFENNICRNIIIDNSHGANGPHNTFLRNRADGFGVFFSDATSPDQNIIATDITNTISPYSLFNYRIMGTGHFLYGNSDKGTIKPTGTTSLADLSYYYTTKPDFVPNNQWGAIGTPNAPGVASIPARDRYLANNIFGTSCQNIITSTSRTTLANDLAVELYPNPVTHILHLKAVTKIKRILISNELGQMIFVSTENFNEYEINTVDWVSGVYFVQIELENNQRITKKVMKI